jgi:hypothetical protein
MARLRLEQRQLRSKDGSGLWRGPDSVLIISVISDDVFFLARLVSGGALESMGLIFINKIEIFGSGFILDSGCGRRKRKLVHFKGRIYRSR